MAGFRINPALRREIERQPEFEAKMLKAAEAVKDMSERNSPIGETGDYIHSFKITRRPLRVGNTDFAGHMVEWGSQNNPPYAPLRRGVRAAGLRLSEK